MTTMLRSAAMTLLSKTLLTFLYKYLSDVDVEGVEMPSLYGSTEGASSGWGVRLSNVKLREGAELMQLPGSKQKHKPKTGNTAKSKPKSSNSTKESEASAASKSEHLEKSKHSTVSQHQQASSSKTRPKPTKLSGPNGNNEAVDSPHQKTPHKKGKNTKRTKDINKSYSSDSDDGGVDTKNVTRGKAIGKGLESIETEEGSLSSLDDDDDARPDTPNQESSMSFLTCFGPGSEHAAKQKDKTKGSVHSTTSAPTSIPSKHQTTAAAAAATTDQRTQHSNSEPRLQQDREGKSRHLSAHGNGKMNGHFRPVAVESDEDDSIDATDGVIVEEHEFAEDDTIDEDKHIFENKNSTDDEESEGDDEDENDEPTTSMALRIGEGGYIGTLDVRYINRELHVLVEDAFLTLEVVTKKAEKGGGATSANSAKEKENMTTDSSSRESPEKKSAAAPAPASAPVDPKELKTTGERVLAMNAIARIFSSIPHLFLRDIVVRLVVLDDNAEEKKRADGEEEDDDVEFAESKSEASNSGLDNADVILDIGIGLLSVTEGEDILSPFHNDEATGDQQEQQSAPPILKTQTSQSGSSPENEYLERRIRTGKGADGGLWLNVVTPKAESNPLAHLGGSKHDDKKMGEIPPSPTSSNHINDRWARHGWLESVRYSMLRCSGLDIQARIFLGTKKELAAASNSFFLSEPETYDIEHTLYGFDHVVPGPTPHLPPMVPLTLSRSIEEGDDCGNLKSQVYKTDRNGIQSSKIVSCFYRVARGMTPTRCRQEHFPCENCVRCWEATCQKTTGAVPEQHHLDSSTPMPGLALSVSLRDPLEVNADRLSLDGLGLLIRLFQKPPDESEMEADNASEAVVAEPAAEEPTKDLAPQSTGYFSSFFFGSTKSADATDVSRFSILSPRKRKSLSPAFPKYMQPENIQIIGMYVSEVRLRVHVMRKDDTKSHNTGLSFCYWDVKGECLTLDQQKLSSEEKGFQDLRLDLAILNINEFKGVEKKVLVSAGVPYPSAEDESAALASIGSTDKKSSRPPWPTTACALLDVPPSHESLIYESRERHAMQLRMLEVSDQPETDAEKSRTLVNCQVGAAEINFPWPVGEVFRSIKVEAMSSLLGVETNEEEEITPEGEQPKDTATQYRVQFGGGRVTLGTMIDMRLPLTRLAGDMCPESGFSMETLVERMEMSYGQSSEKLQPTANSAKGFSLRRLATLPEKARLRILLFVEDLEPLEKALGVKRQSNSFLRCNAVNKGLGKVATKRVRKKAVETSNTNLNRRQEIMNKLLTLDDDALESLWASHHKKQRKAKKATIASVKKPHS